MTIINYRINRMYDYLVKCIIIGDTCVGKSSILTRFIDKEFHEKHEATIGIEFGAKIVTIDNTDIKIQIWDTAGQEAFRAITKTYYRGSSIVMIVYDITNQNSFNSVGKWLIDVRAIIENPNIILIGNKSDLNDKRIISYENGEALAKANNIDFVEISAKTTNNIESPFELALSRIMDNIESITKSDFDIYEQIEHLDKIYVKVGPEFNIKYYNKKKEKSNNDPIIIMPNNDINKIKPNKRCCK